MIKLSRINRKNEQEEIKRSESYYSATQLQLIWWKFRRHKMAIAGSIILGLFLIIMLFCEFLSPATPDTRNSGMLYAPPSKIYFFTPDGKFTRPYIFEMKKSLNMETLEVTFSENREVMLPIKFFIHGDAYKLWNTFPSDRHLFGVDDGTLFLIGADSMGRDMLTRVFYGTRVSLSIGLFGVFISFVIGLMMGGISGFFGGVVDDIIQRLIELIKSIPTIPLWMSLAAILPKEWSAITVYFAITIILGFVQWTTLARRVRSKLISMREEDFIAAAKIAGSSDLRIILRHMLPAFFSYIIVDLTISFPNMILGETTLSFIGLGLRAPIISWGVMLQQAQNILTIDQHPWLLIPAVPVIVSCLAFSLVGDGMRDAADPYSN